MNDIAWNEKNELLGFSKSMWFQCIILYIGMWSGLLVSNYAFLLVAGYTLWISMFGKVESLYYHLLFTLPFTVIYKFSPGSTSLFAYVMIVAGAIITLRKCRIQGIVLSLFMVLALYMVMGMGSNYTTVLKMIAGLLLLYVFVISITPSDFKNQIMAFSLGMLGSSVIGTMKEAWTRLTIYFTNLDYLYVSGERTSRFTGLEYDPNYYAIGVIFVIFLCLRLLFNKEGNRAFLIGMIAVMVLFGFVSYSKMYLFAIVLLAMFFWLHRMKSSGQIMVTIVLTPIIFMLFYRWANNSGYLIAIQERLFGNGDISTGRFAIWESYLDYFSYSPQTLFLGDGLGSGYYRFVGPHNAYIELVYFLGLLGGGLFIFTVLYVIGCVKHLNKRTAMDYTLVVLFLFMIAALGIVTVNNLMFYCMLLWISMNMNGEGRLEVCDKG